MITRFSCFLHGRGLRLRRGTSMNTIPFWLWETKLQLLTLINQQQWIYPPISLVPRWHLGSKLPHTSWLAEMNQGSQLFASASLAQTAVRRSSIFASWVCRLFSTCQQLETWTCRWCLASSCENKWKQVSSNIKTTIWAQPKHILSSTNRNVWKTPSQKAKCQRALVWFLYFWGSNILSLHYIPCMRVVSYNSWKHVYTYIHISAYVYVYIYICKQRHTYICICIRTYIHSFMHAFIH